MMMKTILCVCAMAFATAGCKAPLPDRCLKAYVTEKDVIGTWELTPGSISLLVRDGCQGNDLQTNQIVFRADGICDYHTVLDGFQGGTHVEATGKWALERDTLGDSNVRKKNAIRMELVRPSTTHMRYLNFDRRNGQLVLWSFYGDPDSWEFMEYEKAPNRAPEDAARQLADPGNSPCGG